ncbi:hypothetical protein [Streptococcus pneumoniae]|uniref:hypothetical protein n=1 Tax=Streptococcus pneumoniae TaxID=1313 RepID=UPI000B58CEE5|nr:hypothetical protein [Streptococcus pneumoniae]
MRIKEQTRKLAAGCSKHCFEVVDEAEWFEEIFEEYDQLASWSLCSFHSLINQLIDCSTFCLQNLGKGFLL